MPQISVNESVRILEAPPEKGSENKLLGAWNGSEIRGFPVVSGGVPEGGPGSSFGSQIGGFRSHKNPFVLEYT